MRFFLILTSITSITFSSFAYNTSICNSRADFAKFFQEESIRLIQKHCQSKFGIQGNTNTIKNLINSKYQGLSKNFQIVK
jgi:hypothetical protein